MSNSGNRIEPTGSNGTCEKLRARCSPPVTPVSERRSTADITADSPRSARGSAVMPRGSGRRAAVAATASVTAWAMAASVLPAPVPPLFM